VGSTKSAHGSSTPVGIKLKERVKLTLTRKKALLPNLWPAGSVAVSSVHLLQHHEWVEHRELLELFDLLKVTQATLAIADARYHLNSEKLQRHDNFR
jgi:hypothetical protein